MKAHIADQAGRPESRQPLSFLHLFAGLSVKPTSLVTCTRLLRAAWLGTATRLTSSEGRTTICSTICSRSSWSRCQRVGSPLCWFRHHAIHGREQCGRIPWGLVPFATACIHLDFLGSLMGTVKASQMLVFFALACFKACPSSRRRPTWQLCWQKTWARPPSQACNWQLPQVRCLRRLGFEVGFHSSSAPLAPTSVNPRDCCQMQPMRKALAGKVGR